MTRLDPNGCPAHRGSHCEADQAPPSTHRPSGRAAGVAGKRQGRHQDCGDADCIVITGRDRHGSGRQPTSRERRRDGVHGGDLPSACLPRAGAPVRLADLDQAGGRRGCAAAAARAADRASLRACQGGDAGPPALRAGHRPEASLAELLLQPGQSRRRQRERGLGVRGLAQLQVRLALRRLRARGDLLRLGAALRAGRQGRDVAAQARPGGVRRPGRGLRRAPVPGSPRGEGLPAAGQPALHQPH